MEQSALPDSRPSLSLKRFERQLKIYHFESSLMNSTLGVSAIQKPCTKYDHLVSSVASLYIRIVRPSFVFPFRVNAI